MLAKSLRRDATCMRYADGCTRCSIAVSAMAPRQPVPALRRGGKIRRQALRARGRPAGNDVGGLIRETYVLGRGGDHVLHDPTGEERSASLWQSWPPPFFTALPPLFPCMTSRPDGISAMPTHGGKKKEAAGCTRMPPAKIERPWTCVTYSSVTSVAVSGWPFFFFF